MIVNGNALHLPLADESVQCCITSPPYFGLRDYGTATWEGGDPECDHRRQEIRQRRNLARAANLCDGGDRKAENRTDTDALWLPYQDICAKCGARRIDAQLGLEPTPEQYVANMVAVFREVRRVLRPDGTLWLNLGDSYGHGTSAGRQQSTNPGVGANRPEAQNSVGRNGSAAKQLVGIPWRVAFALQADGWWLRSDIVWQKKNPMPESVTDRPTRSHEFVFLLTKSARYFYDAAAIAEPAQPFHVCGPNSRANVDRTVEHGTRKQDAIGKGTYTGFNERYRENPVATRNKRDVWTVATEPYKGAHFATMPTRLIEPCILAGSRPGDVVLDPFAGAGTVGLVSSRLGRRHIGIELNAEYCQMAEDRIYQDAPLWAGVTE